MPVAILEVFLTCLDTSSFKMVSSILVFDTQQREDRGRRIMASKLLRKAKLNNLLRTELVEQFSTLPHYDDLPSSEWIHWQTLKPRPRPGNAKIAHVRGKPRSPAVGQQRQGCSDLSRLINHGRGNQPGSFSHFPVLKAPGLKNHVSREALFPSRCSSSQL